MTEPPLVTITPKSMALFQLEDCSTQLARSGEEPIRVLQGAKSLHAALVAALTEALAGSSGTGAYNPKLRQRWLEFHENNREALAVVTLPNRVMNLEELLDKACKPGGIEWSTQPLTCTDAERELIERLSFVRDDFEHPKPMFNAFEPAWVVEPFPTAARLTLDALEAVKHHLDDDELDRARELARNITEASMRLGDPRFA